MNHTIDQRLPVALLALRLGVFIVMLMWTLDKFVQPGHSAGVFANFYGLSGLSPSIFMILGVAQLILILAFVAGAFQDRFVSIDAARAASTKSGGVLAWIAVPGEYGSWPTAAVRL